MGKTATAGQAIKFISNLTLTEDYSNEPFRLRDWQKQVLEKMFAKDFGKIFFFIPRGNGKSELCAGLALYYLLTQGEGQSIISAASTRQQAAHVFKKAMQMVRADKTLSQLIRVKEAEKQLIYQAKNSEYIVISSEASGAHGFHPSLVVFDDLHTQPNRKLWDALTSAQGSRKAPKIIIISTAGYYDPASLIWEQFDYAKKVQSGEIDDPDYCPILYYADGDWESEEQWKKANPALDDWISLDFMRKQYAQAKLLPSEQIKFKTYYLNIFADAKHNSFVPMDAWDKCQDAPTFQGQCIAALDLSTRLDLTCLLLMFEDYSVLPFYFCPSQACNKREQGNKQKITKWVQEGHIETIEGEVILREHIITRALEICGKYSPTKIGLDRWGAIDIGNALMDAGFIVEGIGQGYSDLSEPMKELQALILTQKIKHGNNPVLRWNIANCVCAMDAAGNIKPDKEAVLDKIDGVSCLAMCIRLLLDEPFQTINYSDAVSWI